MKLRRLLLHEFRHFAHADIVLRDGLTTITGPNGSGKSTLLEAVLWAFYGTGAVRKSEASLRRMDAPTDAPTSAELHFTIDDVGYSVHRSLDADGGGPGPARLLRGDVELARDAAVAAHVAALLGATREQLLHACFTGRRELLHLAQLSPPQRLHAIARQLGLAAQTPARQQEMRRALEREIADADERIRTLDSTAALLAQNTAELTRLRPELAQAEHVAARLHDDWAKKKQDVSTRLAACAARTEELRLQIERLSVVGGAGNCPTCEQPLGRHADRLIERLDDEVYVNAQDMKWLTQRQAQLAGRPADVIEADTRLTRLRAAVQDRAERVARCEQAAQELWTLAGERKRALEQLELLGAAGSRAAAPAAAPVSIDPAVLADIAATAGRHVRHVTVDRYSGIRIDRDGRVHALAGALATPVVSGGDEELLTLLVRLAIMQRASAARPQLRVLFLDDPFGMLDDDRAARLMDLLHSLLPEFPQVIVSSRSTRVAAAADHVVECRIVGDGAGVVTIPR